MFSDCFPTRRWFLRCLLSGLLPLWLSVTSVTAADFVVVVHSKNQSMMSQNLLLQLYLNKTAAFDDGRAALLLHLPRTSEEHQQFCLDLMNLTANQYQSYWSRMVFTGNANNLTFARAEWLLQQVRRDPSAIAYLPVDTPLSGVRQLGFLRDGQWQDAPADF